MEDVVAPLTIAVSLEQLEEYDGGAGSSIDAGKVGLP